MSREETREKRIRKKILQALKQKVNGQPNLLRQYQINILVGKTTVRAPYLQALLQKMQDEELIDCHWRQWESKERIGGTYWALFDHPDNIEYRKLREEWRKESERLEIVFAERKRRQEIENAPRLAREKFLKEFNQFLVHNCDDIIEVICRMYRHYTPRTKWLNSRHWP